ncbi:MAG TPA: metallophosphoesterase [Bacillus sp. (in: firmicutes)]|uniref:metallophosphoesterase n=1 Tax=Bacillus litorisediminis TaxID=2922713 RepID=UPI001FAE63DC|nr:metallophosphoesterase [Bacillus litorisediminis]HWO75956.1 metallophosphoesterase [Bacillus sp. (in: firmicutes)]
MKALFLITLLFSTFLIFYKAYKNTEKAVLNKVKLPAFDSHQQQGPLLHILQISDMHIEKISIPPEQVYNKLAGEKIDLIALTGDFLDKKRTIPKLIPYLKVLQRLNVPYGIYVVFGNHDYVLKQNDFDMLQDVLEKHGCKILQNEHVAIYFEGKRVNIIGVDDFYTKRSNLQKSFSGLKEGYDLVLTHDPNIVLNMKNYHFDYLLSGHFHGGQIHWPKPYHLAKLGRTMVQMNMIKGLLYYDEKPFYISEGLGQTSINIRIGSRPEITLHQLSLNKIQKEDAQSGHLMYRELSDNTLPLPQ